MSGYIFAVVLCVLLVASLVQLLRSRRIREKYVAIWILVALGVIVLGAFPALAGAVARLVGVVLPVNLVFATSLAVLLFVCVQLSVSMSSTEAMKSAWALNMITAPRPASRSDPEYDHHHLLQW